MIGDRIYETSTTTGTGNITLAGAETNFVTFNSIFGTGNRFRYYIVDNTNNVWESGVGYLSASTTLVRESVFANSSGTTALISFSAGTKNVFNDTGNSVEGLYGMPASIFSSMRWISAMNWHFKQTTAGDLANQVYYIPAYIPIRTVVGSLACRITIAGSAGEEVLLGMYSANADGEPETLLAQGTVDASTTGSKTVSVTNFVINPGWYYMVTVKESTGITGTGMVGTEMSCSPWGLEDGGNLSPIHQMRESYSGGWTTPTLPTTPNPAFFDTGDIVLLSFPVAA